MTMLPREDLRLLPTSGRLQRRLDTERAQERVKWPGIFSLLGRSSEPYFVAAGGRYVVFSCGFRTLPVEHTPPAVYCANLGRRGRSGERVAAKNRCRWPLEAQTSTLVE